MDSGNDSESVALPVWLHLGITVWRQMERKKHFLLAFGIFSGLKKAKFAVSLIFLFELHASSRWLDWCQIGSLSGGNIFYGDCGGFGMRILGKKSMISRRGHKKMLEIFVFCFFVCWGCVLGCFPCVMFSWFSETFLRGVDWAKC